VKTVGPAADAGLRSGDVIRGINEIPTLSFNDFYTRYNELFEAKAEKVLLTIKRSVSTKFILLKIDNTSGTDENK
jgi:S1-C subfamily serine protease